MHEMTIGDLARRTGVRASALRFYEDAGLLRPLRRVGGKRRYDREAVRVVEAIRFAQAAGFSIAEVRTLFGGDDPLSTRWSALASAKLTELDALIARATQMKRALQAGMACGCVRIEDCTLLDQPAVCQPGGRDADR
jgi:MerR family transcriptional regulator, redox-sensitive transcriptional activator SoxR